MIKTKQLEQKEKKPVSSLAFSEAANTTSVGLGANVDQYLYFASAISA